MQSDLRDIALLARQLLGRVRRLEGDGRVVPGLPAALKPFGNELELRLEGVEALAAGVPKALQGSPEPVSQWVDAGRLAEVRAATEGA